MTETEKPPTIEELEKAGRAPWKPVGEAEPYLDEQVLFGHVKGFIETFVYFDDPRLYDVVTAWTLGTWNIKNWRAYGPLLLIGDVSSGKTTMLEVLEELAYRGIRGGSMSNSTMFRLSHEYTPTLLVDESQLYAKEEWVETQAFLNERYRRGGRVWRMVGEGTRMVPKFFDAFGATALAQSGDTWEAMRSRSIIVNMEKGQPDQQTLTDTFYEAGAKLRAQLGQYKVRCFKQDPQPSEFDHKIEHQLDGKQILENLGVEPDSNYFPDPQPYLETIHDARIKEIGWPLLMVAPEGEPRENIQSYLEDLEKAHNAEAQNSHLAMYVQALDRSEREGERVSAKEVRLNLAVLLGLDLKDKKVPHPKTIMGNLRTLGFKDTRMIDGSTGILWDEKLMARKRARYGLSPSVPSVPSVTHEAIEKETVSAEATEAAEAKREVHGT